MARAATSNADGLSSIDPFSTNVLDEIWRRKNDDIQESNAGRTPARVALETYAVERPIVLALPRGGVRVGLEVARALGAPLDVSVVRKVGVPWHPELGMGAVAEGWFLYIGRDVVEQLGMSKAEISQAVEQKQREVEERVRKFRRGRARPNLEHRTVILVDDGIATGGTVSAAFEPSERKSRRRSSWPCP